MLRTLFFSVVLLVLPFAPSWQPIVVAEEGVVAAKPQIIQASAVIRRPSIQPVADQALADLHRLDHDSAFAEAALWPNVGSHHQNMVATVDPMATDAGLAAIKDGGNAIDAAIAACLTLGVVDGYNSGIGGGCFILIRTADGQTHAIDGRETAPAAADRDFYRDENGIVTALASRTGPKAVAIPGALKAFEEANEKFGQLSFAKLVEPAAEIADAGFPIGEAHVRRVTKVIDDIRQFPETAKLLLDRNGTPLPEGTILKQPDLADTYRQIAEHGTEWFYEGPFAERVAAWMHANGGVLTESDFAAYKTVTRQPLRTYYRGHEVIGFPLPSSGGVHVAQVLNILESFPLSRIRANDRVTATHVVAEAMKLAFADRAFWPGDPAYADVPRSLISTDYADVLAERIETEQTIDVASHGQPPNPQDVFHDRHTTHISAADSDGNWVAITSTINTSFGSKVIVPGTGVILNNEMDDFSIAPGVPNAFDLVGNENNSVAAGKRPLSSMSPTIVLKDGQPILTVGAAGGPKIITQVLWALINTIDFGMSPGEVMSQPRIHHQWSPDYLRVETSADAETLNGLQALGHELYFADSNEVGVCQMITFDRETGRFHGAHDPRVPGKAAGATLKRENRSK